MSDDVIKVGQYIIIQKHSYMKLHKLNKSNSTVNLGRDSVNLEGIEGCPYYSVFRMIPCSKKGREFRLEQAEDTVELKDEIDIHSSGSDNRNIIDDGRSQKLSATQISELANHAAKASDIVETLISNSNTFHNKTEFSQEKYLRKKQKKYVEFIQILKPNLRLISELMYRLEPSKIQNIRIDTLSQIITLSNVHSEGIYLLYDSGSNGLLAAALLGAIGAETNGKLIHMHPGNMAQKQAILASNFPEEQYNRCISVNIYSGLRQYFQGKDTHETKEDNVLENPLKRKADDEGDVHVKEVKVQKLDEDSNLHSNGKHEVNNETKTADEVKEVSPDIVEENKQSEPKKPRWHYDNITAAELLSQKVDSLIIASKEDPQNIFNELINFVKPGRPFVIYFSVAEPLQNLYIELKSNARVAALKLTCNWMRNYQVLPERTHPEVTMNNQSGFLLTGYVLK